MGENESQQGEGTSLKRSYPSHEHGINSVSCVAIRHAIGTDAQACAAIDRESSTHPWHADEFERHLTRGAGPNAVAIHERVGTIGFICCVTAVDELEIYRLATHPDYRCRGIATSLLKHVLCYAREMGIRRIFLDVARDNTAGVALYEKTGFRRMGLRRKYYSRTGQDALIMSLRT